MYALGHNSEQVGSTKQKGGKAVPRLALDDRGAMLLDTEREGGKIATSWRSAERTSLVGEAWVSYLAGLHSNGQSAELTSLASCLVRNRYGRSESQGALRRGAASSAHGCRPCATCAATNRRSLPSRCCSGRRWRGKKAHSVEMPSEEKQGLSLDGKRYNATTRQRDSSKTANGYVL